MKNDDTINEILNTTYYDPANPTAQATGAVTVPKPTGFYDHLRITDDHPEEAPTAVIKIHDMPLFTRKNLSVISGPSKCGKTAIISVLCAGAIATDKGLDGCAAIQVVPNPQRQAILHVDTEQSRYHHYSNYKRAIKKRAGLERAPDNYYSYNTRELPFAEYRSFLDSRFEQLKKEHGGILFAVIDGAADFITSVNDEVEANDLVSYFEKLAHKYDTHIVLVVHVNPNSEKERGHLGSQLQRKSETVLTIEKDGDKSTLKAKLLRGGSITRFGNIEYKFDDLKGYHVFMEPSEQTPDGRQTALKELADLIFTRRRRYAEALILIQEHEECGERTAKSRMKDMTDANLIEKTEEGLTAWYSLNTTPPV